MRLLKYIFTALLALSIWPAWAGDRVVIIGHASMRKLDMVTVQRIYTGKVVEIDGSPVTPLNAAPSQATRQRFLTDYLQQDEEKFVAYWTVRRYVGKGTPPREVKDTASMIDLVSKTPGAIGYVDEADVTPAMNVLLKK
jgi:ABC-type phosphate transport system substrate-binding protein